MKRQVLGVVAASAAAPYLGAASLGISTALRSPGVSSLVNVIELFMATAYFGTVALVIFGIPVLAFAAIAALILYALDTRSIIVIAATIGACFGSAFALPSFHEWPLIPGCLISGWIYWRIALCGQPAKLGTKPEQRA